LREIDPGTTAIEMGARVMTALADLVESAMLVAATVMLCCVVIVEGALYIPFVTVPIAGVTDQATAVFELPVTDAENCIDWLGDSDAEEGDMDTDTGLGCSMTEALAVAPGASELVAINVTVVWAVTEAGAMYNPLATVPRFGTSDHEGVAEGRPPFSVSVNCADCPGAIVVDAGESCRVGVGCVEDGSKVIDAEPLIEGAYVLAAITVTVCDDVIVLGAV